MLYCKSDRYLLFGGQFALLVAGFCFEVGKRWARQTTSSFDVVMAFIVGHAVLLAILAWRLRMERREQDRRAATLNNQLNRALKKANDLIESSSDLVWEIDSRGRFTFVSDHNAVMGEDWGLKVGMLVTDLVDLDPVTPRETWTEQLASNMRGEPFRNFHYSLRRSDGKIAYFCVNGIPIYSEAGDLIGFRGTTRDRTDEIEALQASNYQAEHDALTGLPNRRFLMQKLDNTRVSPEARIAVLQLDLDGFKTINDLHGHATGDQLLRQVAERLRELVRDVDFACRLGGDEFVIVMLGSAPDDAVHLAQRVMAALQSPFHIESRALRISVSIGIALSPDHGPLSSFLLRLADQALYEIKRTGGSGLRIYQEASAAKLEPSVQADPVQNIAVKDLRGVATLLGDLELVLPRDELLLVF